MKYATIRMVCIAAVLLGDTSAMKLAASPVNSASPVLVARMTMLDGTTQEAALEGVGCSVSICSRVVIKGKSETGSLVTTPLDTIAAIKEISRDHAVLVLKDGKQQRLSLVTDFRVLYLSDRTGRSSGKVDLAAIKSIEFTPRAK